MLEYTLPEVREALAYLDSRGALCVAFHGLDYADDRLAKLTPAQALRLAEYLVRAAREAMG